MPSEKNSIAGVDGCPAGWYVVLRESHGALHGTVCSTFESVIEQTASASVVGIDIPIGLPLTGARDCDREARALLGKRGASVFPAPIRAVIDAKSYAEASAGRRKAESKGMSVQAFGILRKVREVDQGIAIDPSLRARFFEVHPEVSFVEMAGSRDVLPSKKTAAGRARRVELLREMLGDEPARLMSGQRRSDVAVDDVLDACAAMWTADRIATGRARSLPAGPQRDNSGDDMRIWY